MHHHLAQLKAFCEAHPIETKVLIVPAMGCRTRFQKSRETDGEVKALCEQTSDQVHTYAKHWAHFTGEPIAAKGLWLTLRREFRTI